MTEAFQIRSESDYDDYYIISREEIELQIRNAQFFLDGITEYVKEMGNKLSGVDCNEHF